MVSIDGDWDSIRGELEVEEDCDDANFCRFPPSNPNPTEGIHGGLSTKKRSKWSMNIKAIHSAINWLLVEGILNSELAEEHVVGVGVFEEFELEMLVVGEVESVLVEGV